ncbi:MAG: glutathione S-transferase family protein [Pseudomonadota bacterium]
MALTLYSMPSSGNSYKVRLLLALLGREYRHISCEYGSDGLASAKASGKAPTDKVPSLEFEDGTVLAESNAILFYLANGTPYWPEDKRTQADVLSWMFFEQNRHEGVIAVRTALSIYPHRAAQATPARMAELLDTGHQILGFMETHLEGREWFAGGAASVADLALYGYTHTADTLGGFDLSRFPAVKAWLDRVAGLPGYIPLDYIPDG